MPLGPVPQFFSNQPDKSLEELKKSPEFAFGCLQALVSKLVERGELSRQACFKLRNQNTHSVQRLVSQINKNKFYSREEAAVYTKNPSTWDTKRGLKRSWSGEPVAGSSSATPKQKASAKLSSSEKGGLIYMVLKCDLLHERGLSSPLFFILYKVIFSLIFE